MSSKYAGGESRLEPLGETGSRFSLAVAVFALLSAVSIGIWLFEVTGGHIAHLGNWGTEGAVPWGLDIGAFTVWAGVGVGAIVLSAAIRLLRLDGYKGYARIGEFLVLPAFLAAFLHVLYDMGRPGRVLNSVLFPQLGSPLFWDIVLMGGLGVLGLVYLLVAGRADANANGYNDGTVRGIAALLLIYVPVVGGGLVPWLMASSGNNVDWFGAVQGPMFLVLGIAGALATILVVAGVLRLIGGWDDQFSERSLVMMGVATGGVGVLYLVGTAFTLQSGGFAPIGAASEIGSTILASGYGSAISVLLIGALFVAVVLASQAVFDWSSDGVAVVGGVLLLIAYIGLETILVAGGLSLPELMYPEAMYVPSLGEIVRTIGMAGVVGLGLLVLAKLLPIARANTGTTE
ncbi:polysulfide reductase NrfD [Halodesulfurarchaeum formicicum]|uniref:Polysulfide reductase NrfD n=1 Tax=Halodesulfurarchaeum formicicum TaxID=1873524 RepID=A0A1D8S381_9EURY|nr:NrfD/PsrC family molybdoenzyme membrane anchor subunit [Halodesulfurarchaeum formicicum]AOW79822.1 polysulfide reductase NrfD [Halodesulfurarchaeum formicicum]